MTRYLLRRLALSVSILLGASLLVFLILHSAGRDPAPTFLGPRSVPASLPVLLAVLMRRRAGGVAAPISHGALADPATIAELRRELGPDRPLLLQYFAFLSGAVRGEFVLSSRSNTPVVTEIAARFPATIELAVA